MRIIIAIGAGLLLAGVALALISGDTTVDQGDKETIVAGFYPLAYAAQKVGGSAVEVTNLTPPGAEPHDLEPTPQDVERLQSANLVLLLGQGFQPSLESAADNAAGQVIELLDTPGLDVRPGDPHVWLDPVRFELVVEAIGRSMDHEGEANRLVARLRKLDREYRAGLADCARRDIVTSHEAFGHLAERYGLRQVAISGIAPEAEPTPGALRRVVDSVRETGATTVFTEPLVSPKLAQTVASETGAATAVLDPIEGLTPEEQSEGDNYFTLMRRNLATLERGLGCR